MSAEPATSLRERARIHAALGDPVRLAIADSLVAGDLSPSEIARRLGLSSNLVAFHLNVLADAGVITRSRSEGDRRRTYLRLRAGALPALIRPTLSPARRIVFVCTRNSARSQLAAALWLRRSEIATASAGTDPAPRVHPGAVRAAQRHGLALDSDRTTPVDEVVREGDLVIAVCDQAHESLPAMVAQRLHWSVPDPVPGNSDEAFDATLSELCQARIDALQVGLD